MKGIRDEMFDIGGPYREDARCFRAEAISSCAVVLTLTAAETRLTERSSVWRRRGTVTYHLENRGGGHRDVAIQLLFPLFHHRCLLMPRIWRPTIDRASLPFLLLLLCFRPFAPWSLSNLGRGDCCVRRFIARLLILLCGQFMDAFVIYLVFIVTCHEMESI